MALFLVRDGHRLVWVVKLTDDVVMFCYDGPLCRFCQSHTCTSTSSLTRNCSINRSA